ncbi:hypothetical protein [Maridesulfovibrio sp.]|uniref:hypothetical protein n=1 Tax=Maridesulfovibrio sp. TaxID=2795000 RepID=UPI002A186A4D|nr:hypothetical protein [Maridesulfovibrio sp.]
MNGISTDTLAALYPMESPRMLRNYALFLEEYPEWVENGFSLMDYKDARHRPEFSGWTPEVHRQNTGRE